MLYNFFQIYARSILNKMNQIQNFVYSNDVDILDVTDTYLTATIYDQVSSRVLNSAMLKVIQHTVQLG